MNWRPVLRAAVILVVLILGWMLRTVTVPLLAAYLLMLIWRPAHDRLERRVGRGPGALLCVLMTVLLPLALVGPTVLELDQVERLFPFSAKPAVEADAEPEAAAAAAEAAAVEQAQNLDDFAERILMHANDLVQGLPVPGAASIQLSQEDLKAVLVKLLAALQQVGAGLAGFLGGVLGILSGLFLLPIFLYFLLTGGPWIPAIRQEIPPDWHERFDAVFPRIQEILRKYCGARVLVAAVKGLMYWGVLLLAGFPAPYTLALLAGGLSLLPVLGSLVGFVLVAIAGFADQGGLGLGVALVTYLVTEVIEGYVLLPRMVGRGLGLSDFSVILAALAGGALAGIFGLLVAIPAVAVAKVLYDEFVRPIMGTGGPAAGSAPA